MGWTVVYDGKRVWNTFVCMFNNHRFYCQHLKQRKCQCVQRYSYVLRIIWCSNISFTPSYYAILCTLNLYYLFLCYHVTFLQIWLVFMNKSRRKTWYCVTSAHLHTPPACPYKELCVFPTAIYLLCTCGTDLCRVSTGVTNFTCIGVICYSVISSVTHNTLYRICE